MKKNLYRLAIAAVLYYVLDSYAQAVFVMPFPVIRLSAFLPPVLGIAWGPVAAFGVAAGSMLPGHASMDAWGALAVFLMAYLPYKLWHVLWVKENRPLFSFTKENLGKFVAVLFLSNLAAALLRGCTMTGEEVSALFAPLYFQVDAPLEYAGILFLNDFDVALFFGMPMFFLLVANRYPFYMPSSMEGRVAAQREHETNRLALISLYGFFLLLFLVLDVSGILYDLDQMDTWLRFNGEILTSMNLTMAALIFMLMRYRHSIMTDLMLMDLAVIFIAASMLGSVSFMALSQAIDEHVENDMEKMSVIYRERLAHAFKDTIMAVNSMNRLATDELESYARLKEDAGYRKEYLARMEHSFAAIAENSPGSIGFYLQLPEGMGDTGFLCCRSPEKWGQKLPDFQRQDESVHKNRYHNPQEQYLAKLSVPYWDAATGRTMISYVVPMQKDGEFVGIIGVDIDFNYIIHEIKRMSVYEHGIVRLLDKNGAVLYSTQTGSESLADKNGLYETESYLSPGVWLKISAFAHDIYADRNAMLIHFVMVMLFIVIAVSLFSVWLARKGIRPLMVIAEAARKIAAGDLNVKLPRDSRNELGTLVRSIREMVSKLEIHVYRDKLTGLRNTAAYIKKVEELEQQRMVASENHALQYGVIVFDANLLKKVNDTYGHEAGNELICRASSIICQVFGHSPVFRIGGDEFVAILEHHDYDFREKLLAEFDRIVAGEQFEAGGDILPVSVARGMGVYQPGMDYAAVFRQADDAMYENKAKVKKALLHAH